MQITQLLSEILTPGAQKSKNQKFSRTQLDKSQEFFSLQILSGFQSRLTSTYDVSEWNI